MRLVELSWNDPVVWGGLMNLAAILLNVAATYRIGVGRQRRFLLNFRRVTVNRIVCYTQILSGGLFLGLSLRIHAHRIKDEHLFASLVEDDTQAMKAIVQKERHDRKLKEIP